MDEAKAVVDRLRAPLWFPVAQDLDGQVSKRRVIVREALGDRIKRELGKLQMGFMDAAGRLQERKNASGTQILVRHVLDDIDVVGNVLDPFADFLMVDEEALTGPALDLIGDVLVDQIEYFDDTRRSPKEQLEGRLSRRASSNSTSLPSMSSTRSLTILTDTLCSWRSSKQPRPATPRADDAAT